MKKQAKGVPTHWRENRPLFATIGGFAATVLFALYNGGLGIWYSSPWHESICIYYILLSLLRGILLVAEWKAEKREQELAENYRKRVFCVTSGIVLAINVALTMPISLMVLDRRPIQTGLIPAIASAAYTTYKISAAVVKLKRTNGTILEQELNMIRLVDALVSVLVLQNTLIIAVEGGIPPRLFRLAAISSAGIFLLVFAVPVAWFIRGIIFCQEKW